jgi:hypothetical protein
LLAIACRPGCFEGGHKGNRELPFTVEVAENAEDCGRAFDPTLEKLLVWKIRREAVLCDLCDLRGKSS